MAILFQTREEYRTWIFVTIVVFSFIGKDFTYLIASFWIGWTVAKVPDKKIDVILTQMGTILIATIIGTIIGYKYSLIHFLDVSGWI